jgi:PTH1 family peptidyl-tRNA hydrolase
MKLIVGLGNPENEENFANTRHNMGFNVINLLAKKYDIEISRTKFNGLYGSGIIDREKVILLKPQTYMNVSGECIIEFMNFYKISEEDIIVIYDDIDIEPGKIRIRRNGSPSTHNGMKSIVHFLKTENFARIRVGIGKPSENEDMITYVIGDIPEEEKQKLQEGVAKAEEAMETILQKGIDVAMNLFN